MTNEITIKRNKTGNYPKDDATSESQIYAEDGAKNMALFRRALMNMIKAHPFNLESSVGRV